MTVLVAAAAAPRKTTDSFNSAAPKFAAQTFLLVGKDGKTYARLHVKGDQPTWNSMIRKAL